MKTRIFLIAALLIVSLCNASNKETETTKAREIEGSMNVWTTPDLYSLTMIWTAEFTRVNPKATINVLKSDNANVAGMLKTPDGVGFITDATYAGLDRQSIWTMLSGHDIIVPVMNKKNLFLEQIYRNGITTSCLTSMFNGSEKPEWGTLLGTGVKVPLHFYIMNDASIKAGVASFLNNSNFMVDGTNVGSSSEMIAAIRKDINAIGFCRLTDILEPNGKSLAENLAFVPIDKNGNGRLDYMENIYNSPESFAHGVWIGKYPKELSGNLYMVAKVKPANPVETAFLEWVLSDGQQYLATNGFISLGNGEMLQQLAKVQTGRSESVV
jgi:ABC-type phosphate transport system substrate-binding protein